MEDPVEINRRIGRLVRRVRRRDDYGKLLARGDVVRSVADVEDPDGWRAEIKRQARSDRIKVRTGQTGARLWAFVHGPIQEAQQAENDRYFRLLDEIKTRADRHGHSVKVALHDGEEVVVKCEGCAALGYGDAAAGPLIGGAAIEEDCPDPAPPDATGAGWPAS
ncbi:MAG: hypothetical protein JSS68_02390 [Actinobacteria bacterium]|nr:hypothetical protein [Actinomycetota bacterium]MBS1885471.1 hypothetical protein [Actinomycetota bacterium]